MKHKIVIGVSHSGFHLNESVEKYLLDEYGIEDYYLVERHDPRLVETIEKELVEGNNPHMFNYGRIKIVEINSNQYRIVEYDARESVETPDKITWIEI